MRSRFIVLLITMPAVEVTATRGRWVSSHCEKEFSDKRNSFVTAGCYMAALTGRAWTLTVLLSVVALVWVSVGLSLLRPPLAPNRTQEEVQQTLAATVVYPLP